MILIAGHGRSGTGYTAKLLQEIGLDVGHEIRGNDGIVSWAHVADGHLSWLDNPVKPDESDVIIHQIRHPLRVISSAQTMRDESFEFMFNVIGHPGGERGLRWYMYSWLKWNEYVEQLAQWSYRLEDLPLEWPKLVNLFDGVGMKETPDMPQIPKNTNTRKHSNFSWGDLKREDETLFRQILDKARAYGYKIDMPSISLCMMGGTDKDFEYLPDSLQSTKGLYDDFVFLNTLSHKEKDFPQELLESYGARVYAHQWEKNFSLHRNQSLSYCLADWVFLIDCDESLFGDFEAFKLFLAELPEHIVCVKLVLKDMHKGKEKLRFNSAKCFKRGYIHYKSIVHNQPVIHGGAVNNLDLYVEHYGYDLDEETQDAKHQRTESLLLKRIEENPDDFQAYFYLSQIAGQQGDIDKCIEYSGKYIDNKDHPKMVAWNNSCWFTAAQAWGEKGDMDKAKEFVSRGLEVIPGDIDLNYMALKIAVKENSPDDVLRHGQQYLYSLKAFQDNPAVQKERFTYMTKQDDYGSVLFHLAYIYGQKARNFFNELFRINPDKAPELVGNACQEIGVRFDVVDEELDKASKMQLLQGGKHAIGN